MASLTTLWPPECFIPPVVTTCWSVCLCLSVPARHPRSLKIGQEDHNILQSNHQIFQLSKERLRASIRFGTGPAPLLAGGQPRCICGDLMRTRRRGELL